MAEVEHVPGVATVRSEDVAGGLDGRLLTRQHQGRVEIALERPAGSDPGPGSIEWDPEVDADDVGYVRTGRS